MNKTMKLPGPDHPITITPESRRITVTVGGTVIADSTRALSLKEASYPAVLYIPREDVRMDQLERTEHATYCPYKGDCAYYNIRSGGERGVNAVWTYEHPFSAVNQIASHLAFYPDRVDAINVAQG
ncbi:DUF427 domain-containing protein [Massilia sp. 9I]|uniref:DUF427 domain-containing protein n=1 Tax=Massilia sp. 9I TaxID=2653152 RepID=UPI00135B653F|nr:DUF427 domain-containing protein [Massilia sp. 9I]